jgi:sodium transport system ATP-binding protein
VRRNPEEVRARIGFLSGNTALYPRLTVRETLEFFGHLHGFEGSELEARIANVIQALDMHQYADRRLEHLSTGMTQKANIGRTLLHDPPVLILDEPTSGLDILGAAAMIDFVEEMKHRGKSVIFSTHNLSEAERLCDRIGVLHAGRMYAVGSLDELRERTGEDFLDAIFLSLVKEATRQ